MAFKSTAKDLATPQYSFFVQLDDDLQRIEEEIKKNLHSSVPLIALVTRYIMRSGGKRLRPLLMVLASRLANYQGNYQYALSIVFEVIPM